MSNSFTLVIFSFNSSRVFSFHDKLGLCSSLSQIPPQSLTYLSISGMAPSYSVMSSILLNKFFQLLSEKSWYIVINFLFFPIDYYQTNLHFCIPFGIVLHFCSLVSNCFCSPFFFCKATSTVYRILNWSSFLWEATVPLSSSWNSFLFFCSFKLHYLHYHCYISIATQCCCFKLIILIHISHEVCSLTQELSVHPGLPGSLHQNYTDRCCQFPSGTIHDELDAGSSATLAQLTPLGWKYDYLCNLH